MIIFHYTPATYWTVVGPLNEAHVSFSDCTRAGVLTSGRIIPHFLHLLVLAANTVTQRLDH